MMIARMIIQNSVIKVSRCCCDYLADTLRMALSRAIGRVLFSKGSEANRTGIRAAALEGRVMDKESLDVNILKDKITTAPNSIR
jgi:lipopolysaccharide biosynthesis regulator YciM